LERAVSQQVRIDLFPDSVSGAEIPQKQSKGTKNRTTFVSLITFCSKETCDLPFALIFPSAKHRVSASSPASAPLVRDKRRLLQPNSSQAAEVWK
jgi:hypothetical protein